MSRTGYWSAINKSKKAKFHHCTVPTLIHGLQTSSKCRFFEKLEISNYLETLMHEAERPRGVNDGEKDQRKWINKCLPNCTTTLHWQNGVKLFIKKYILMASFMQSCFHKKCHFKMLMWAPKIFLYLLPGSFHFSIFCFLVKMTKKWKNQLSFSGKIQIFYTENKQTGQLIFFDFGYFDKNNEKRKMEWTRQKKNKSKKIRMFL